MRRPPPPVPPTSAASCGAGGGLTRRALLASLSALALALPRRALAAAPRRTVVAVLPLGPALPAAELEMARDAILASYDADVRLLEAAPLPRDAYYPPRARYRAEKLLDHLSAALPAGADRIVGLTSVDISTTKGEHVDWGILGLATIGGPPAVVSRFRCGRGARSTQHARERFGKVVAHELGHALGLPHCQTTGCLMEDAGGTVTSCDREYALCAECRRVLTDAGVALAPDGAAQPWPAP